MVHNALQKTSREYESKIQIHFLGNLSANRNQANPNLYQKKGKSFQLWHNRVDSPLVEPVNQNFFSIPIL